MTQINPPFDGGAPCPMCPGEIRGIAALVHNFLTRWPEPDSFVKLNDLRTYGSPDAGVSDNPEVRELLAVTAWLRSACAEGMTDDGMTVRWAPEVRDRVANLIPRAEAAMYALQPLSDEHFRDQRHSHGQDNILRASRGSVGIRFLPKYDYDYTVDVSERPVDLTHETCGTHLRLHSHFKDQLAGDPTFYAKVWCPACMINAPFDQFAVPVVGKRGAR